MIVDCPKCGFSQPSDNYCAKCGVNMMAFQKKPASLFSRLLSNPSLHISALAILVAAGSFYIFNEQQKLEVARRIEYLKNGPAYSKISGSLAGSLAVDVEPISNSEGSLANASNDSDRAAGLDKPPGNSEDPQIATLNSEIPQDSIALASLAQNAPNPNPTSPQNPAADSRLKLIVSYSLVSNSVLNKMVQEARSASQMMDWGDYKVGVVKNLGEALKSADVLEKVERSFTSDLMDQTWFVGKKAQDIELGLHVKLNIHTKTAQGIAGEIEVLRSFYETTDYSNGPQQKGFSVVPFELPAKYGLFVVVPLPRVVQDSSAGTGLSIMRAFRMTDFMTQKQSEFVILIETAD